MKYSPVSLAASAALVLSLGQFANAQGVHADVPSAVAPGLGRVRLQGESNAFYILWFSAVEEQTDLGLGVILDVDPIRALAEGLLISGNLDEAGVATFDFPVGPDWAGDRISFQAVTSNFVPQTNDGLPQYSISNLARATFQAPNTFRDVVGNPGVSSHRSTMFVDPDGRMLSLGGSNSTAQLYQPWDQNTLTGDVINPPFPVATNVQLADGNILVAGGIYSLSPVLSAFESYILDTTNGNFTPTNGTMTIGRGAAVGTRLLDGRVLIVGGVGTIDFGDRTGLQTGILSSSEIYDPNTGLFSPGPNMPEGKIFHTVTTLSSGLVMVAGGLSSNQGVVEVSNRAFLWNPFDNETTDFYSFVYDMGEPRMLHSAVLLPGGRLALIGGVNGAVPQPATPISIGTVPFTPLASTATWIEFNPTFDAGPTMTTPRALHASTFFFVGKGGDVLVTGGVSDPLTIVGIPNGPDPNPLMPAALTSTEIINFFVGFSSPGPEMNHARAGHCSAVSPMDGRILVSGGGPTVSELYQLFD